MHQPLRYEDHPLQDLGEFDSFIKIAREENVKSYLEIGSAWGGSIWRMSQVLPKGARIVSVDKASMVKKTQPSLEDCFAKLRGRGFDAHVFFGDSADATIVAKVKALAPFDLCFIDADHILRAVTADWHNYGPLARIVGFHDISFKPTPKTVHDRPIEVPEFWAGIKNGYRYQEFRLRDDQLGIGVLWKT